MHRLVQTGCGLRMRTNRLCMEVMSVNRSRNFRPCVVNKSEQLYHTDNIGTEMVIFTNRALA